MSQLEDIKARADKATPGPWGVWGMQVMASTDGTMDYDAAVPVADTYSPGLHRPRTFNADFIAHARTDLPKLVAALEDVQQHHNVRVLELRAISGLLNDHVALRVPEADPSKAARYAAYLEEAEAAARAVQHAIDAALR